MNLKPVFSYAKILSRRLIKSSKLGINKDIITLSAAQSFYMALSFAPIVIICLYMLDQLGFSQKAELVKNVNQLLGPYASNALEVVISNSKNSFKVSSFNEIFGSLVLIFSSGGVFAHMHYSINFIWDSPTPKSTVIEWLQRRAVSTVIVLLLAAIGLLSILANTALNFMFAGSSFTPWAYLEFIVSAIVFIFVFFMIFKYLPYPEVKHRHALRGSILTAILFVIGKNVLSRYLSDNELTSSYGVAGVMIVFLVWVYYSSIILMFGACYTKTLSSKT